MKAVMYDNVLKLSHSCNLWWKIFFSTYSTDQILHTLVSGVVCLVILAIGWAHTRHAVYKRGTQRHKRQTTIHACSYYEGRLDRPFNQGAMLLDHSMKTEYLEGTHLCGGRTI